MTMEKAKLTDAEVFEILEKSREQYNEYLRIMRAMDRRRPKKVKVHPRYDWDTPIGLVITKSPAKHGSFQIYSRKNA